MAEPLSTEKIDKMRTLYLDGMSILGIAKTLGVHEITVRKYRNKENWIESKEKIKLKAQRRMDDKATDRRVRKANIGLMLQKAGSERFLDEAGRLRKGVCKVTKDAIKAIVEGVRLEDEAFDGQKAEINIEIRLPDDLQDLE